MIPDFVAVLQSIKWEPFSFINDCKNRVLADAGILTRISRLPTISKGKEDDKKKKMTKVLSTKLSIEDYNRFEKYTRQSLKPVTIGAYAFSL